MTTNNNALSALQALAQAQYKPRNTAKPTPLAKQVEKVVLASIKQVDIDMIPSDNLPLGMTIEYPQTMELVVSPVPAPLPEVPENLFERYKRQVDELCDKLKIDRADLLLMAIEHLYQAKLSN